MTPALVRVGRDLSAGAIVSVASVAFYMSVATLLFQGPLASHLPAAMGAALTAAAVLAVFGAVRGSLPLASMGPVPSTVSVQAVIATSVAAQTSPASALPTVVAAMVLTGVAVGGAWWVLGRLRAGDLIRFIPYPVIGGFLGAVGWLLLSGGMAVAVGRPMDLAALAGPASGGPDVRLLCGLALGALIAWTTRRFSHVLVLPGLIVLTGLAIHAGLALTGLDLPAARASGWLLAPFGTALPVWPWSAPLLGAIDWTVLTLHAGLILSAVIAATVTLMLSESSLEVAWETRADINRDLRVLGSGNLVAGLAGGLVGSVSINQSVLNRDAGAASRGSGFVKAGLCLLAMAWGGPVLALVPRPLLGALLIALGLALLKSWLWDSRRQLPLRDQLTVWVIVATTALIGLLPAVSVGVLVCCLEFAVSSARQTPLRRMLTRSAWPTRVERSAQLAAQLQSAGRHLRIVELQGVLFFGSVTRLTRDVEALLAGSDAPRRLLFDFGRVSWVDTSAGQALSRLFKSARHQGVGVDISAPSAAVRQALATAGGLTGEGLRVFADIDEAVSDWDDATLAAQGLNDPPWETRLAAALPGGTGIAQVMGHFESVHLAAGDVLFAQGDAPDALYLVQTGRLGAYVQAGERALAVRTILPGSVIGEMGLLRNQPRSATIRAEHPGVVLRLSREALAAMEARDPALAAAVYRWFLRQLADRIDQLTAQSQAQAQ